MFKLVSKNFKKLMKSEEAHTYNYNYSTVMKTWTKFGTQIDKWQPDVHTKFQA